MPIVAAVDQSERAETVIKQGRVLADNYGVELHVVHVGSLDILSERSRSEQLAQASSMDAEDVREKATETAAEIAERVESHDPYRAVGLIGDPTEELITYSREQDAECIVVSSRKRSRFGQALFGSVTQSLLLTSDRPVVAVP